MVQVYEEPLCRRHYAPVLSATNFIRLVAFVGTIVATFALCFSSGGFWTTTRTLREQPYVKFTQDMVVLMEVRAAQSHLSLSHVIISCDGIHATSLLCSCSMRSI